LCAYSTLNDTAPTPRYTRSLHDALPIFKSVIVAPLDGAHLATNTPLTIRGVAWGGDASPVTAVDVSVDGGRSWKPATLSKNQRTDRKSTRLNSSHEWISYAVFCLKKKTK